MGLKVIPSAVGRLGGKQGGLSVVGGAAAPVVLPWYLATGVSAANCIGAYRAKGAADLAASYVNLAKPGTNDLAKVTADPVFNTATGWSFAQDDTGDEDALKTGILLASSAVTIIVRFSDVTTPDVKLIGKTESGKTINIVPNKFSAFVQYWQGTAVRISPALASGVVAIAGTKGYRNGVEETAVLPTWSGPSGVEVKIGNGGEAGTGGNSTIQACAIYDTVLTAAQVLAISTAMAAL